MKLRHIYLFFCLLGTILPYSQFIPWFMVHGLNLPLFFTELFSTKISSFIAMDLFVTFAVLVTLVIAEGLRLKLKNLGVILGVVILAAFSVGVSLAFPLFLYLRQRQIENNQF